MSDLDIVVKGPSSWTDMSGQLIESSAQNKIAMKTKVFSKTSLLENLENLNLDDLKAAARFALRELGDLPGLQDHYLLSFMVLQPKIEDEAGVNGGSRLDPNLIDEEEDSVED